MSEKYNLIFNGDILPDFDENEVKEKVAKILNIPVGQREAFFSGRSITLKENLSLDAALKLKSQLENLGLMISMLSTTMAEMYRSLDQVQTAKAEQRKVEEAAIEVAREKAIDDDEEFDELGEDEPKEKAPAKIWGWQLHGRLGRLSYFNGLIFWYIGFVFLAILLLPGDSYKTAILQTTLLSWVYVFCTFRLTILRLHDLNLGGWYCIILFIPILRFFMYLYMLFGPGTDRANDYGEEPDQGSVIGLLLLVVLLALMFR